MRAFTSNIADARFVHSTVHHGLAGKNELYRSAKKGLLLTHEKYLGTISVGNKLVSNYENHTVMAQKLCGFVIEKVLSHS